MGLSLQFLTSPEKAEVQVERFEFLSMALMLCSRRINFRLAIRFCGNAYLWCYQPLLSASRAQTDNENLSGNKILISICQCLIIAAFMPIPTTCACVR